MADERIADKECGSCRTTLAKCVPGLARCCAWCDHTQEEATSQEGDGQPEGDDECAFVHVGPRCRISVAEHKGNRPGHEFVPPGALAAASQGEGGLAEAERQRDVLADYARRRICPKFDPTTKSPARTCDHWQCGRAYDALAQAGLARESLAGVVAALTEREEWLRREARQGGSPTLHDRADGINDALARLAPLLTGGGRDG